jgi:hypothetical protein
MINGDTQIILDRLTVLETKQEERHIQNKEDINVLFKKLRVLDSLKCNVHDERMGWMIKWLYGLGFTVGGIITWIGYNHLVIK